MTKEELIKMRLAEIAQEMCTCGHRRGRHTEDLGLGRCAEVCGCQEFRSGS